MRNRIKEIKNGGENDEKLLPSPQRKRKENEMIRGGYRAKKNTRKGNLS